MKEIRVLRLNNDNIDAVWELESSSPDVVLILECDSEALSTQRMEAIVAWAKKGHGVFIQAPHLQLSSYLLPSSYYLEGDRSQGGWELARSSRLLWKVHSLKNYLWCADRPYSKASRPDHVYPGSPSMRFMQGPSDDRTSFVSDVEPIFSRNDEEFIPILMGLEAYLEEEPNFVLFASTLKGARVVWYSGRVNFDREDCLPQHDDAMLWANLMHWLAAKKLPGAGETET